MQSFDEFYESLWANIHKKRQRIKKGSGEKMRKVGDKGAPTPAQMKRAKSTSEDGHTPVDRVKTAHKREKEQDRDRRDRELDRARLQTARQKNTQTENAPSLAVLKKKIKS